MSAIVIDGGRRISGEFGAALALLTRLPAGWLRPGGDQGRAVWAFPLVGALVGAIGAATLLLGRRIGLPPGLAAAWTLAAMVLATGALHEDGLADTADGFGGGATAERKLFIMRDSRIGSFGAIALVVSFAVRGSALAAVGPAAVIAGSTAARAAIVGVLWLLRPARPDGLSAGLGAVPPLRAAAALVLAAVLVLLLLPLRSAAAVVAAAAVASLTTAWLARRQIGGHTGDVCGAAEQGAECLAFTALAASLAR